VALAASWAAADGAAGWGVGGVSVEGYVCVSVDTSGCAEELAADDGASAFATIRSAAWTDEGAS